jgi:hypothetical protein
MSTSYETCFLYGLMEMNKFIDWLIDLLSVQKRKSDNTSEDKGSVTAFLK